MAEHRSDRFEYGSWDCALFVCGAIESITDIDPAVPFRNRYASRSEAMAAVAAYCGKASLAALVEKITSEHAMTEIPVLRAARGDVVVIRRGKHGLSLGMMALNGRAILTTGKSGIKELHPNLAVRAWRV